MPERPIRDAEALTRLEQLDPATDVVRDRGGVSLIEAAVRARDDAETGIEAAVRAARHDGVTWTEIAVALGVSQQATMKRYRDKV